MRRWWRATQGVRFIFVIALIALAVLFLFGNGLVDVESAR